MEYKNRIEITFSKNRHYPEYGENAYNIENHEIVIPYGKRHYFKNSASLVQFIKDRIDDRALEHFSTVSYSIMRGNGGEVFYLKNSSEKSDCGPIDSTFAEILLTI
jgi:hypothetical protein